MDQNLTLLEKVMSQATLNMLTERVHVMLSLYNNTILGNKKGVQKRCVWNKAFLSGQHSLLYAIYMEFTVYLVMICSHSESILQSQNYARLDCDDQKNYTRMDPGSRMDLFSGLYGAKTCLQCNLRFSVIKPLILD